MALLLAALAVLLAGAIRVEEMYGLVDWRLLVLIGGMTSFGLAMEKTGAAHWLAAVIAGWTEPLGVYFVLGTFLVLTMLLTQPMSNAAAALVVLPVAVSTALEIGVEPRTFALLVTLAASLSDDHVFAAVCAGASGYLLKDTPPGKLLESIREVQRGGAPMSPGVARRVLEIFQRIAPPREEECRLSPRELELIRLLAEGRSYKSAAALLGVSHDTVRFHVRNIYAKLHVHSKSEAVVKALCAGLVH